MAVQEPVLPCSQLGSALSRHSFGTCRPRQLLTPTSERSSGSDARWKASPRASEEPSPTPAARDSGQCDGLRDHKQEGEQFLMSQRDHVTHNTTSQNPKSPPPSTDDTSPASHAGRRPEWSHGPVETSLSRPRLVSSSSEIDQHAQTRQSSVFAVLNPAGSQMEAEGSQARPSVATGQTDNQPRRADHARLSMSPPQPAGFVEGTFQHHHHHHIHHHRQPAPGRSVSTGNFTNRSPPTASHPGLASEEPRRILTPRSPRSLSTNHQSSIRPLGQALGQLPDPLTGRQITSESSAPGRFDSLSQANAQPHHVTSPLGARHTPHDRYAELGRPQPHTTVAPLLGPHGEQPRQDPGQSRFGLPPAPTPPPFGAANYGPYSPGVDQGWTTSPTGFDSSRSSRLSGHASGENQLSFAINPVGGERMVIPVETYSGSRQADEKRQRNAGASARFRKRKKTKEEANVANIQRLEKDLRDLERRVQEAQMESDRLRSDRDRLREVVHRTPETRHLAFHGPPSPASARSTMHMPGRSPMTVMASPSQPANSPYGVADSMTGERASRRRRTESSSESVMAPYGIGQPVLPALTSPSFQHSHPGTPHSIARPPSLPPLSNITPPPQSGPSNFEPGPPTSAPFQPGAHRTYETGWAVGSDARGKSDARR